MGNLKFTLHDFKTKHPHLHFIGFYLLGGWFLSCFWRVAEYGVNLIKGWIDDGKKRRIVELKHAFVKELIGAHEGAGLFAIFDEDPSKRQLGIERLQLILQYEKGRKNEEKNRPFSILYDISTSFSKEFNTTWNKNKSKRAQCRKIIGDKAQKIFDGWNQVFIDRRSIVEKFLEWHDDCKDNAVRKKSLSIIEENIEKDLSSYSIETLALLVKALVDYDFNNDNNLLFVNFIIFVHCLLLCNDDCKIVDGNILLKKEDLTAVGKVRYDEALPILARDSMFDPNGEDEAGAFDDKDVSSSPVLERKFGFDSARKKETSIPIETGASQAQVPPSPRKRGRGLTVYIPIHDNYAGSQSASPACEYSQASLSFCNKPQAAITPVVAAHIQKNSEELAAEFKTKGISAARFLPSSGALAHNKPKIAACGRVRAYSVTPAAMLWLDSYAEKPDGHAASTNNGASGCIAVARKKFQSHFFQAKNGCENHENHYAQRCSAE